MAGITRALPCGPPVFFRRQTIPLGYRLVKVDVIVDDQDSRSPGRKKETGKPDLPNVVSKEHF
jgi:hypothetical protein